MNDNNKVAVSPSRPLIGSTDGVGRNAERKSFNLREADFVKCCQNCEHAGDFLSDELCEKHNFLTKPHFVCDDYE